jgi:GTPase Era involved in 16S rRNA processing
LKLWVRVTENWIDTPKAIAELGYESDPAERQS